MEAALIHIADYLKRKLQDELARQGHVATGDLGNSIEVVVEEITNGFELKGSYLYYGKFVDTGRAPGVTRVPIDALLDWIYVKGISFEGKSEMQTAFAIQTSIFNKGIPTDGDPDKLRWMSGTIEANETELDALIREAAGSYVTTIFNNLVEESQKAFYNTEIAA